MIAFPRTVGEAAGAAGAQVQVRAGGTDVMALRRRGLSAGPLLDLRDLSGLDGIEVEADGVLRVGALATIARLAADPAVRARHPALAQAAAGLATPQVRAMATVGGNLLQRTRCAYFRNPAFTCFKSGGTTCPAREGDHRHGSCFDLGPCVAPHPSTLGLALLAHDATVEAVGPDGAAQTMTIAQLLVDGGDGSDGTRDHFLPGGSLLTAVRVPAPWAGERGAYVRIAGRERAEWPLADAVARVDVAADGAPDGTLRQARVAVGGVAPVPLRRLEVETALVGQAASPAVLAAASRLASAGARPLPQTGYKVALVEAAVLGALEAALGMEVA